MTKAVARVSEQLQRIRATDANIRAWVSVDETGAMDQAYLIDEQIERGQRLDRAGVTIGVKDILDVSGMPTVAGFAPFANTIAQRDAVAVARLRMAGAVIIGKTVTTQFAAGDPAMTRNPWNIERTPGGSSSGSAAAVAAHQVDLALGTQSGGSVLRPAAYCGVTGFKPAQQRISRTGLMPLAPSLDTIGIFGRTVTEIVGLYDVLANDGLPRAGTCSPIPAPRIGIWADALAHASADMRDAVIDAIEDLARSGTTVYDAICPASFDNIVAIFAIIMRVEAAAVHRQQFAQHPDAYEAGIRTLIEVGQAIPADVYARALLLRDELREEIIANWSTFDLIALPTTETAAPDRSTTGNPSLQAIATLFKFPAITIPIGFDKDHLPLGIQLFATQPNSDVQLLRFARWIEARMPTMPAPPLAHGSMPSEK